MRVYYLIAFFTISVFSFAQYSSVALSEANAKKLGDLSKGATLFIVIKNEKSPADAALINAVKNYWKQGSYKFMARAEFIAKTLKYELPDNGLFLYEWVADLSLDTKMDTTLKAYALSQKRTRCYSLSSGFIKDDKPSSRKDKNPGHDISLKFDLAGSYADSKSKILDGYFDLMVKYFNNEVTFCQKLVSIKEIKKEDKDGIVYFDDGRTNLQSKDILLVKEQVDKTNPTDKKSDRKASPFDAVSQFNPSSKNVYTVFPEDVKMAVSKNDKQVLIYSNDMLLSAYDGSVVAAPMHYGFMPVKKDYGFWLAALSILASAFAIATVMK